MLIVAGDGDCSDSRGDFKVTGIAKEFGQEVLNSLYRHRGCTAADVDTVSCRFDIPAFGTDIVRVEGDIGVGIITQGFADDDLVFGDGVLVPVGGHGKGDAAGFHVLVEQHHGVYVAGVCIVTADNRVCRCVLAENGQRRKIRGAFRAGTTEQCAEQQQKEWE